MPDADILMSFFNLTRTDSEETIQFLLKHASPEFQAFLSAVYPEYSSAAVHAGKSPVFITREKRAGKPRDETKEYRAEISLGINIGEAVIIKPADSESVSKAVNILQKAFTDVLGKDIYQNNKLLKGLFSKIKENGLSYIILADDPDTIAEFDDESREVRFDTDTAFVLPENEAKVLFALAIAHEFGHFTGMNEREALLLTLSFVELMDEEDRQLLKKALENEYVDRNNHFRRFIDAAGKDILVKEFAIQNIILETELKKIEKMNPDDIYDTTVGLKELPDKTGLFGGKAWNSAKPDLRAMMDYIRRQKVYETLSQTELCQKLDEAGYRDIENRKDGIRIYYDMSALIEMDKKTGMLKAKTGGWNYFISKIEEINKARTAENQIEIALVTPWDKETALKAFYSLYDAEITAGRTGSILKGVSAIVTEGELNASIAGSKKPVAGITIDDRTALASALKGRAVLAMPFGCLSLLAQTAVVFGMVTKTDEEDIMAMPVLEGVFQTYKSIIPDIEKEGLFKYENGILYFNLPPVCRDILNQLNHSVTTKICERYA